jgi:hypothetical protein
VLEDDCPLRHRPAADRENRDHCHRPASGVVRRHQRRRSAAVHERAHPYPGQSGKIIARAYCRICHHTCQALYGTWRPLADFLYRPWSGTDRRGPKN